MTGASPRSLRDPRAVEGRGHDEEAQILAQAALRVERQREAEIGIEGALVELVEEHRRDAVERRDRRGSCGRTRPRSRPRCGSCG